MPCGTGTAHSRPGAVPARTGRSSAAWRRRPRSPSAPAAPDPPQARWPPRPAPPHGRGRQHAGDQRRPREQARNAALHRASHDSWHVCPLMRKRGNVRPRCCRVLQEQRRNQARARTRRQPHRRRKPLGQGLLGRAERRQNRLCLGQGGCFHHDRRHRCLPAESSRR